MNKSLRRAVIAGNWKMNLTPDETAPLINEIKPLVGGAGCDVCVCVPFVDIAPALAAVAGSNIGVGAQNVHFEPAGAYTGEISASMLGSMGVQYVIIGHSERRQYFNETDETVAKKTVAALGAGLTPIVCVGELLAEREAGKTFQVVDRQLRTAFHALAADEMKRIIIAYEPVWAIGTGKTATADQAQEVCEFIRGTLVKLFAQDVASAVTIQYGGSMNAANAAELLSRPDVDGGLIGGASLKAGDFAAIVKAAGE